MNDYDSPGDPVTIRTESPIRHRKTSLFTLSELLIASTILVIITASLAPLAITAYRNYAVAQVRSGFESEILTTQEWIKRDMASSARDEFRLWPRYQNTGLTAVSFPVLRRGANAAGSPVDVNHQIQWTHTVVYHLFDSGNGTQELRRTVFEPRNHELSDEERYAQLEHVHLYGNGSNTFNGNNASTQTLLNNITHHNLLSQGGEVDGYAPDYNVVEYHSIGTWIIDPGDNSYIFTVSGKNESSIGHDIGIDQLFVSATGLGIDAECLSHSSQDSTPTVQSMSSYSGWSNNAELFIQNPSIGDRMTVSIYNDSWLESTFVNDQARLRRAEITHSQAIGEIVCRMIGLVASWSAQVQSLNQVPHNDPGNYNNRNIRVIISGSEDTLGENIIHPGKRARVTFRSSGSNPLHIQKAYFMKRDMDCELGYNGIGTVHQLTFAGNDSFQMSSGQTIVSDYIDLEIETGQDYLVSYYTTTGTGNSRTTSWEDLEGRINSFVFHLTDEGGNSVNLADEPSWTDIIESHGDDGLQMLTRIVGVENVMISYPESSTYTTRILDTRQQNPKYETISWRQGDSDNINTSINMRVRAGDNPDLSDAGEWDTALLLTSTAGSGSLATLNGRYIQWQAELKADSPYYLNTPNLRDVEVRWEGKRRAVDVTVAVGKGPGRGIFELTVNDQEPQPAQLRMQFSLGKEVNNNLFSRDFAVEITPRN